jgi:hypothetical protein
MERETERSSKTDDSRRQGRRRLRKLSETPEDRERVRILAYEIYESRRGSGMLGDPVSDWLEAERRLNEPATAEGTKARPRRKPF